MPRLSHLLAVSAVILFLSCSLVPTSTVAARSSQREELEALTVQVARGTVPVGEVFRRANEVYLTLRRQVVALRSSWAENAATLVSEVNALQARVTRQGKFVASLEKRINATDAKIAKQRTRAQPLQAQIDALTANATSVKAEIAKGDATRADEKRALERKVGDSQFVQNAIQSVLAKLAESARVSLKSQFPDTLTMLLEEEDRAEEEAASKNPQVVSLSDAVPTPRDPMMARFMETVLDMSKKVTDAKALSRGLKQLHDQVGDFVTDLRSSDAKAELAWNAVRSTLSADLRKLLEARWDARSQLKALLDRIEVLSDRLAELRENRASLPAVVNNLVAQVASRRKLYSTLEASFKSELSMARNELSTARALVRVSRASMAQAVSPK